MGRKPNTKGKEKRLARREEQQRLTLAKQAIDKANKLIDPLEPFAVFRSYNKNGIDCDFYTKRVVHLEDSIKDWAFGLTKKNMQHKYENCSWGWNDNKKYEELTDDEAWYLVAKSKDNTLLGFSHFRFDLDDDGTEVLYCYELQLESGFHRRGLGKFMMQILELIAFTNNMRKVVLTVLKNNSYSTFFKAINYQIDEGCPIDDEDEVYEYEILSKINRKLVPIGLFPPMPLTNKVHHHHPHGHNAVNSSHQHQHHCCPGHH